MLRRISRVVVSVAACLALVSLLVGCSSPENSPQNQERTAKRQETIKQHKEGK